MGCAQANPERLHEAPGGQADHGDGDHEYTTQIMAEHMVVLTPPQQRMRTIAGEEIYDNAQPIDDRHDPGACLLDLKVKLKRPPAAIACSCSVPLGRAS
jgi:hypothetical protein